MMMSGGKLDTKPVLISLLDKHKCPSSKVCFELTLVTQKVNHVNLLNESHTLLGLSTAQ